MLGEHHVRANTPPQSIFVPGVDPARGARCECAYSKARQLLRLRKTAHACTRCSVEGRKGLGLAGRFCRSVRSFCRPNRQPKATRESDVLASGLSTAVPKEDAPYRFRASDAASFVLRGYDHSSCRLSISLKHAVVRSRIPLLKNRSARYARLKLTAV